MAKARPRKTAAIVAMPARVEGMPDHQSDDAIDRDIARRAYELYCERGRRDGHDLDDWLEAERNLRSAARVAVA